MQKCIFQNIIEFRSNFTVTRLGLAVLCDCVPLIKTPYREYSGLRDSQNPEIPKLVDEK